MKIKLVLTHTSLVTISLAILLLGITTAVMATDFLQGPAKGPPPPPPPYYIAMVRVDQPVVHAGATNITLQIVANERITFSSSSYGLYFERMTPNGTWVFYRSVPGNNVTTVLEAGQTATFVYNFSVGTFPLGQYQILSTGQSNGSPVSATYAFKGEYQGSPSPPAPYYITMAKVDQPVVHAEDTSMTIQIVAITQITFTSSSYNLFFEKLLPNGTWVFYRSVPGSNVTTVLQAGQTATFVYGFPLGTFPIDEYQMHSTGQSNGHPVSATYSFKGEYQG
jgi:hypothetical protein